MKIVELPLDTWVVVEPVSANEVTLLSKHATQTPGGSGVQQAQQGSEGTALQGAQGAGTDRQRARLRRCRHPQPLSRDGYRLTRIRVARSPARRAEMR